MELLHGETLGERMARLASVPTREACQIMGQVLSALDAAHSIGVVHRDLKPENIFMDHAREIDVRLLDFGVSKFHPPGVRDEHITKDGLPVGTPHYMAPEQWTGQRDVDHRADLFAAGVMFYEMLTGGLPYEGSDQRELFDEVVRGGLTPPGPSAIAPGVPSALDAVVLKAVSRDREQRFQSAKELLDAIRPFGADAEIRRPPPGAEISPDTTLRNAPRARLAPSTMPDLVEATVSLPASRPSHASPWLVFAALATLSLGVVVGAFAARPSAPSHHAAAASAPVIAAPAAPVVAAPAAAAPAPSVAPAPAVASAVPSEPAVASHTHRHTRAAHHAPRRRGSSMAREF